MVTADSVQSGKVPIVHAGMQQAASELQPKISTYSVATYTLRHAASTACRSNHRIVNAVRENGYRSGGRAYRPAYLALSLLPVVLGSVAAWTQSISPKTPRGDFHPIKFAITIIAVLLLQMSAHLINDYYDYLKGIDTNNSLGPGGLIQQGIIKPVRVLVVGLIALGLGILLGALVAFSGSGLIIVFGLIGVLAAYFYSGIPKGLSSLALGEIVSFFIFGPLLTIGSYMVQTGHLDRIVLYL